MRDSRSGPFIRVVMALVLLPIAIPRPSSAQQTTGGIQGVVIDGETERPLEGAQIFIVGTDIGGLADGRGQFVIEGVSPGDVTVEVRMLGYRAEQRAVDVEAGGLVGLEFSMTQVALELDAVVVTGTAGGARQREVGSSISRIDARQVENAAAANLQGVLQGRASGLAITQSSGQPGAGAAIRLRGNNSITQGNEPLIYVDGVRMYSGFGPTTGGSMQAQSPLNDIRPQDIERVEVIRGPAATTLYGTEASGGVIQIFTRQGSQGPTIWSAEITSGANNIGHFGPKMDPTGLTMNECTGTNLVDGLGQSFNDVTCPSSGSWLQNGLIQRYSLGMQGGTGPFTWSISGHYRDEEGVIQTGYAKEGGFRANFTMQAHPTLNLEFVNSFNRGNVRWVPEGNRSYSFVLNVLRGPGNQFKRGGDLANGEILEQEALDQKQHLVTGFTIRHEPTPRFSHRLQLGYDHNSILATHLSPLGFQRWPDGYFEHRDWTHGTFTADYVASYRRTFGESISSTSSWGAQLYRDTDRYIQTLIEDFAAPDVVPTLTLGARRDIQEDRDLTVVNAGFFAQQVVGFSDRLFLTAGLRVDGNSAFGSSFGLQPYPKVSGTYILSEHDFWPADLIQEFKLRAAVGDAGKAPGAFDAVQSWAPISVDDGEPGFTPAQLGNADLGPERTREYEAGFDASALDGRLSIETSAYLQRTRDALIPILPIPSLGFTEPQLENLGLLESRGAEVMVDVGILRRPSLEWNLGFQASQNRSEALDLGGEDLLLNAQFKSWVREGYPVPSYFGDKIVNPDEFAEPVIEEDQFLGGQYPTRNVGITTSLTLWNDLTIDALGEYQGGAHNINATGWLNTRRNIWPPCYEAQAKLREWEAGNEDALSDVTALDRVRCTTDVTRGLDYWWIEATDFFKLRHVTVTYDLRPEWIPGARSASLSISGHNLWSSTNYTGLDPEMSDSGFRLFRVEYYNMPQYRQFTATLRVRF